MVARLGKTAHVQDIRSPFDKGNEGQISKDADAALVTFSIPGDADVTDKRVDATLAATATAQSEHPDLRIEQFGDASADKALGDSLDDDFKRAEFLSLPITLIILIVAFGALVAAGVPLLLAITAVIGTLGLVGPISQIVPMEESANSRDPADRARGRRRLLDVLPAAQDGGARRGRARPRPRSSSPPPPPARPCSSPASPC